MYNPQEQSVRLSSNFALGTNEENRSHREISHQWNRTPGSLAGTSFTRGIYDPSTRGYSDLYASFSAPRSEANRARSLTNQMMSRDSAFDFDEFSSKDHPLNQKKSTQLSRQLQRMKAGASIDISTRGVDLESTISYLAESLPFEVGIAEYQGHATLTRGSGTSTSYKFLNKEKLLGTYHSHPKSGVAGFGRQDIKSYLERLKKYGDFPNYVAGAHGVVATLQPDESGISEKLSSREIDYLSNSLFAVETSKSMGGIGRSKLEQSYKELGLVRGQDYLQNVSSTIAKGSAFSDKHSYLDSSRDDHDSFILATQGSGKALQGSRFHQNLESGIGQWLKSSMGLPFMDHSTFDPKKSIDPRILSKETLRYADRDVIIVETSFGPKPFYRSTGHNSGKKGTWFPFDGITNPEGYMGEWFDKSRYTGHGIGSWVNKNAENKNDPLHRYGSEEFKSISEGLSNKNIPQGREVLAGDINDFIDKHGVDIKGSYSSIPEFGRATDRMKIPKINPISKTEIPIHNPINNIIEESVKKESNFLSHYGNHVAIGGGLLLGLLALNSGGKKDRDDFVDSDTRHIQHESNIVGMLAAGGIWSQAFYKGFNNPELDISDRIFAGIAKTTTSTQKISLGATAASLAWSMVRGRSWEERLQGGSLALAAGLGDIAGRQITEKILLKSPIVQEFLGKAAGWGSDIFGKSSSKFFTKTSNDWRLASEELLSGKPSQAVLRSIGNLGMEVVGFPIELFFIAPMIGGVLGRVGRAMDGHVTKTHKKVEEKQQETSAAMQQQAQTITNFIPADKINTVGSLKVNVNRKDHPVNLPLIDNALENQIRTGWAYIN
jgi:hypothetical protein